MLWCGDNDDDLLQRVTRTTVHRQLVRNTGKRGHRVAKSGTVCQCRADNKQGLAVPARHKT